MVANTRKTWKMEVGGTGVEGQPQLSDVPVKSSYAARVPEASISPPLYTGEEISVSPHSCSPS
ncbi:hypothetical protein LEMLEM_LOCUS20103 [Lemmus lemmus]